MICPQFFIIWAAAVIASNYQLVGYEVFVNGALAYEGRELRAEYCFNETDTYTIEILTVAGADEVPGVSEEEIHRSFKSFNVGTLAQLAPMVVTPTPAPKPRCADLDRSGGVVGFNDYVEFAKQYGHSCEELNDDD